MNKLLWNMTKFISIFCFFILLAVIWEMKFNSANTTKEISILRSGDYSPLCSNQIALACYYKHIPSAFESATPFGVYLIINTNIELFQRSMAINNKDSLVYESYLKNWSLISDNLQSFEVRRDKLHFFQLLFTPFIKLYIQKSILSTQKIFKKYYIKDQNEFKRNRQLNRFLKLKIELF